MNCFHRKIKIENKHAKYYFQFKWRNSTFKWRDIMGWQDITAIISQMFKTNFTLIFSIIVSHIVGHMHCDQHHIFINISITPFALRCIYGNRSPRVLYGPSVCKSDNTTMF
jgi:hypothetical protein